MEQILKYFPQLTAGQQRQLQMLDELYRAGKLKPGSRVILNAFGAGLCTGTALIEF